VLYRRPEASTSETEEGSDGLAARRQARSGDRIDSRDPVHGGAVRLGEEGAPVVVNGCSEERVEEEFFQTVRPTSLL